MATITEADVERANRRMDELREAGPLAVAARYDAEANRVVIDLDTGVTLAFPPELLEGLQDAKPEVLSAIEISPSGLGIYFPKPDVDLYLPALTQGVFGSRRWMASLLGKEGGKSRSVVKQEAARNNGRLGGRPKKETVPQ
jgi:Protein of unknown function (DUF2442)